MTEKDRKADAAPDDTSVVEFRDETFTVHRDYQNWTVDFMESLEEGKAVGIVRGALGPDQWRKVRAMDLTMRDLSTLGDLIAKAMGFGATGESAASSD